MIDGNERIEGRPWEKSWIRRKEWRVKKKQEGKKNRWEKTFQSLHVTPPVHTCTTAALWCENPPHRVPSLNCYSQNLGVVKLLQARVFFVESVDAQQPHQLWNNQHEEEVGYPIYYTQIVWIPSFQEPSLLNPPEPDIRCCGHRHLPLFPCVLFTSALKHDNGIPPSCH